jgi:hypothetical protein
VDCRYFRYKEDIYAASFGIYWEAKDKACRRGVSRLRERGQRQTINLVPKGKEIAQLKLLVISVNRLHASSLEPIRRAHNFTLTFLQNNFSPYLWVLAAYIGSR